MHPSSLPSIQAVTFDVGLTLIEPWPGVGEIYAAVAAQQGYPGLDPARLEEQFIRAWSAQTDFQYTRAEWAKLVDATFAGHVSTAPSTTFFASLYEQFAQPESWRVFDDDRPTLEALAASGLRLGLISNWDDRLRPLLGRLDLARYFDPIIISCEAGCTKPAAGLFAAAARRWNLAPELILHIGDSAAMDQAGAQAAGFRSLLLNRGRAGSENSLESLQELPERLGLTEGKRGPGR